MPVEYQNVFDLTLTNCINTNAYLDNILIITKGSLELHKKKLQAVLTKLDEKQLSMSLDKRKFACKQIDWLGYKINSEGNKQLIKKTEAIEKITSSKTFKQLRSFMGYIHHLTRYIPMLAQTAAALSPLLRNTKKIEWKFEHNTTFSNILKLAQSGTSGGCLFFVFSQTKRERGHAST